MSDSTPLDPATQALPAQVKTQREPMDPKDRATLTGVLGVAAIVAVAITVWVHLASNSGIGKAKEKTDQVTACAQIEDSTAALACVVQIDQ